MPALLFPVTLGFTQNGIAPVFPWPACQGRACLICAGNRVVY